VDRILQAGFLGEVREKGKILRGALERIASTVPGCSGVKGLGMLAGIEIDTARTGTEAIGRIVTAAQEAGFSFYAPAKGSSVWLPPSSYRRRKSWRVHHPRKSVEGTIGGLTTKYGRIDRGNRQLKRH
jgi:acetylornithine/succinyldiaminopimelate/putrescine aminotransferase